LRWARALYEAGSGQRRAAALLAEQAADFEERTPAGALFRALAAYCWAIDGERGRANVLVRDPPLAEATTSLADQMSQFAAAYHALALWVLGRTGRAAQAMPPVPAAARGRDRAILRCMRDMCLTSPAHLTRHRFEIIAEPLLAAGLGGHVRFLAAALKPAEIGLTSTEVEMLRALKAGGTTREAAALLGRSPRTLEHSLENVCRKLNVSGRMAAVVLAVEEGWI
jgi:DNA-binding CsgD family transcriptional regulator